MQWAKLSENEEPTARKYFLELGDGDRAKCLALFQRFADTGIISNREKFRKLGEKAGRKGKDLWEFKSFQDRFIGGFRPGRKFIIAHAVKKKGDEHRRQDIERALTILSIFDLM